MKSSTSKASQFVRMLIVCTMPGVLSCGKADFSGSTRKTGNALTQEEPAVGFEGAMTTVSLALNLLRAPQVKLLKADLFNGRLYLNLDCTGPKADDGSCGSNDDTDPLFALRDLKLGFISISQSAPLLSQIDYDRIQSVNFDDTHAFRARPEGGVEVGPLNASLPNAGDRLGVVLRRQVEKEGEKLESFKVFFLK